MESSQYSDVSFIEEAYVLPRYTPYRGQNSYGSEIDLQDYNALPSYAQSQKYQRHQTPSKKKSLNGFIRFLKKYLFNTSTAKLFLFWILIVVLTGAITLIFFQAFIAIGPGSLQK